MMKRRRSRWHEQRERGQLRRACKLALNHILDPRPDRLRDTPVDILIMVLEDAIKGRRP